MDFTALPFVYHWRTLPPIPFYFFNLFLCLPITAAKEFPAMIELTRLNGTPIVLNSDLIKTAEASPDTMLTLINGEKLIVREDCSEVTERVLAYRSRLLAGVARRLPSLGDLQRVTSIASLDVANPSGAAEGAPRRDHPSGH
jgi:flagellar protein FlbD